MSASIIRVTAGIFKHADYLGNLLKFLQKEEGLKLVTVSSLPEIVGIVGECIDQVYHSGADSERIETQLNKLWEQHVGGAPNSTFGLETAKLAGLLRGIYLIGDYSAALKDVVMSQSEILTAILMVAKIEASGVRSAYIHPADIGLTATGDFGNATYTGLDIEKTKALSTDVVWVVPGSFGITENGKVARAGKSAADYTAAFLVGQLDARRLVLWEESHAFYAADHAIVPEAGIIDRLTYSEASELAYFDHFIFHPRTVEPLIRKHIPIHVIQAGSLEFNPGTVINGGDFVSPGVVKSVAYSNDISILKLNGPGVGLKPGILARITGKLAESAVNIKSVITSQVSINILLDRKSGRQAKKVATDLGFTAVSEVKLLEDVSLIAIVGHGMQSNYGISAKLFGAVAQNQINVILSGSGASDLVSYLLVNSTDRDKSVKAIYQAFFSN